MQLTVTILNNAPQALMPSNFTAPHPKSSPDGKNSAGMVSVTAIAAIGNSRSIPRTPKSIVVDAQIFVGSPSCESLLGVLRYYNANNLIFHEGSVGLYLINTSIFKMTKLADIIPTTLKADDYSFIGDINWIVPLSESSSNNDLDDTSSFSIDPCQRALLHISGIATNCNKDQGTFDIDLEHYVSALKDSSTAGHRAFAPLSCVFSNSPRYKHGKPVPWNNRYVSVSGFLTDVIFEAGSEVTVDRFQVTVDDIIFMGAPPSAAQGNDSTQPNALDLPNDARRPSRNLIDYGRRLQNAQSASSASEPIIDTPTTASAEGLSNHPAVKHHETDPPVTANPPPAKKARRGEVEKLTEFTRNLTT